MDEWPAREGTLDVSSFRRLYRGAVTLDGRERRVRACYAILLTGRLGMHPEEVLHLHEGWIDWKAGTITVPEKDPCACRECWNTARDLRDYDEPALEVLYQECWSPPPERSPRTIPFGWSRRITAALRAGFEEWDAFDVSREEAATLVDAAASNASDFEVEVTFDSLPATGTRFLADLGLPEPAVARLAGVAPGRAQRVANGAVDEQERVYRLAESSKLAADIDEPHERFPIACNPGALDEEPFSPVSGDRETRIQRAGAAPDPDHNPRPVELPDNIDYDPDDHADADPPERRPAPTPADAADGGATAAANGGAGGATSDQSGASGGGQRGETGRAAGQQGAAGGQTAASASEGVTASATAVAEEEPRDLATEPILADITTTVAADPLRGNMAFDGQVVLGQDELVVEAAGQTGDRLVVAFDDVVDVSLDYVPPGLDDAFDATVGVAYESEGARNVVVVGLPEGKRRKFAMAVFHGLLHVTPVTVTHPAKVAGRVTDEEAEPMVMYVRPDRVEFADEDGEDLLCLIDLSDIIHVDKGQRTTEDGIAPVVSVRHVEDDQPVTTMVGTDDERLVKLFERYVRREYRETLQEVRSLSLSDPEKMIVVALYSTEEERSLSQMLDLDPEELSNALVSLEAKDLIRAADTSTSLTGKGQLAVSDRLGAVNE